MNPTETHPLTPASARPVLHDVDVVSNERICRDHFVTTLRAATFPAAHPGQFVHVGASSGHDAIPSEKLDQIHHPGSATTPFLRRAFSIADLVSTPAHCDIRILYRVIGLGTKWLSALREGDSVSLMGPLGQPFERASEKSRAILIAGGVGSPPVAWYADRIQAAGGRAIGFLGAQSADLLALAKGNMIDDWDRPWDSLEFNAPKAPWFVCTDDGSRGLQGTVVDAFHSFWSVNSNQLTGWTVFTCGPERMMQAVAECCNRFGLRCIACLERAMACGTGTCQSCAVPVRDEHDPEGWRYELCCMAGPVFNAQRVIWETPVGRVVPD